MGLSTSQVQTRNVPPPYEARESQLLYVCAFDMRIPLPVKLGERRLILGRSDAVWKPDVDLIVYHAQQHGVSRKHAALDLAFGFVTLIDLNSANGTYLNSVRLVPYEVHRLYRGDEIRLGKLVLYYGEATPL